jgi:hypothetical protein
MVTEERRQRRDGDRREKKVKSRTRGRKDGKQGFREEIGQGRK